MSHIKRRDILISTIADIVAGVISLLSYLALWSWSGGNRYIGSNLLASLLLLIFEPFAAIIVQLAISHPREFEADRLGADTVGSGRPLANALRKLESANKPIPLPIPDSQRNIFIVNLLITSGFSKPFFTHPPIDERIRRLLEIKETRSIG
jgi:heat shock protein HtpX